MKGINSPLALTCHSVALHAAHFVLSLQWWQQGSPNGDAIHHSTELKDNRLLLQAFRELRKLIGFYRSLIDAGRFVRGLWSGGVFSIRRVTARKIQNNIHKQNYTPKTLYVWYCDMQILPHVPVNINTTERFFISSAHLQLYKYINIILNITMETDQFWGSNWQQWGCSEISCYFCYFCQWCVSSED